MYDELVKRLWECASGECFNCSQYTPTTNASVCSKELMKQAADAIEVLSKPRWIPVSEKLPEKSGVYLGWMQWDLTDPDDNPSAYPIEYDAEGEAFGWWKSYLDPESLGYAGEEFTRYEGVTHWMPLPQPPKAEEGET